MLWQKNKSCTSAGLRVVGSAIMFANKILIATFASLVPAKPLHNAQIGGAFFIYTPLWFLYSFARN